MLMVRRTVDNSRVDTRTTFWNSREKRDSIFRPKILARFSRDKISSETRFTWVSQTKISQRESRKASLAMKFRCENRFLRASPKKCRRKTSFSRVSQTNFVVRLASLANRNFVARLARSLLILTFESSENLARNFCLSQISRCELWLCLFVSQAWQYIAFFPSCETHETHETRTDIFVRSEAHFVQNSREKNCETRLSVNPRQFEAFRWRSASNHEYL